MNANGFHPSQCKRCRSMRALRSKDSVLALCQPCLDDVFPGSSVDRYRELQALFGR